MVWEHVATNPRQAWGCNLNGGGFKKRLAGYASVSREWNEFFASKMFRKLTVNQLDLSALSTLLPGHRKFVKHIWLRVMLYQYDCNQCHEKEDAVCHGKNTDATEDAIEHLFFIMDEWCLGERDGLIPTDVTLEISIHSPSDKLHYFQVYDFDVTPDDDAREFASVSNGLGSVPMCLPDDPLQRAFRVDTPHRHINYGDIGPICRLFGRSAIDARFEAPLIPIPFITRFMVRRQTRRRLNGPAMRCILAALPNLQAVAVEFWREWTAYEQQSADHGEYLIHLPRVVEATWGKLPASC